MISQVFFSNKTFILNELYIFITFNYSILVPKLLTILKEEYFIVTQDSKVFYLREMTTH